MIIVKSFVSKEFCLKELCLKTNQLMQDYQDCFTENMNPLQYNCYVYLILASYICSFWVIENKIEIGTKNIELIFLKLGLLYFPESEAGSGRLGPLNSHEIGCQFAVDFSSLRNVQKDWTQENQCLPGRKWFASSWRGKCRSSSLRIFPVIANSCFQKKSRGVPNSPPLLGSL